MDGSISNKSAPPGAVTERLRELAQGGSTLDVAQLQFVGLEEIRVAYGDRWPQQKTRIRSVAEDFLRRRMDPSDLLISAESGFVVVFGSAVGPEAEAIAGQLSQGLSDHFLGGTESDPSPRFTSSCNSVAIDGLAQCLGKADLIPPHADVQKPESFAITELEWRYQPVWDVKREALTSWYVSPHLKSTGRRVPGYMFETQPARARQFAAIDEACLWVSEQALKELIAQGKQALIGVSINARTLTNVEARIRIFSVIDRLDKDLFRFRVIKIAGVAPGFPRLYLGEIVHSLKSRGLKVVIGAAWDESDMAGLLNVDPLAVGVALPPSIAGPGADSLAQALMDKLGRHQQRAHIAKVRFFVEGDMSHRMALSLAALGADSLSSPRIWPTLGTPDAMMRWAASRLAA